MVFIKGLWRDLRTTPVDTLVRWQERRFLWLLMACAMGGLIILAHSFFQIYLYMAPCEQCVYIRFAMFVMVFGGLIAAINPKNVVLKLIGCIAAFYGSIMGIKFSLKLNDIHHAVHSPDSLFGVQGCSTDPTFPFNLPLANWAPEWFIDLYQQSEGWYLLPPWQFMNMAQACLLAFGLCLLLLVIMSGAWALKLARAK